MNQINPYRRNCEIMRKFFAKPIFLIIGIALLIYVISNSVFSLLSNQFIYFDFMSVAMCIAFFLFYFKARSKKDFVSFRAPTVLLDVVSIIGIVFSGLITLFSGFLTVLFMLPTKSADIEYHGSYEFLWSTLGKAMYDLAVIILPVITVLGILFLFFFIAMQRMTLSFKKSLSTVYLQRKGSVMFGIASIILAVVSIICYSGVTVIPFMGVEGFFTSLSQGINISALAQGFLVTLLFVLFAILGFMYNSYIKKLVSSIETGKTVQPEPSNISVEEINENDFPLTLWEDSETNFNYAQQVPVTYPVEFTPLAVFGDNEPVEPETKQPEINLPKNDTQNPYLNNTAVPTKRCANCGKENPNVNIFCGNCGNRL